MAKRVASQMQMRIYLIMAGPPGGGLSHEAAGTRKTAGF